MRAAGNVKSGDPDREDVMVDFIWWMAISGHALGMVVSAYIGMHYRMPPSIVLPEEGCSDAIRLCVYMITYMIISKAGHTHVCT